MSDVDISVDTMFVARGTIYRTCDADRDFLKKLCHDILDTELKDNAILRALQIYHEDGEQSHTRDSRWRQYVDHEIRLRGRSTATPRPLRAEDAAVWHISILRSRFETTPWFFDLSQM